MIKGFLEWINESKEAGGKATVELEFDWTWADQMTKGEATRALKEEFDRIGFPKGLKLVGRPTLTGWPRKQNYPQYDKPYDAEFEVSYTGTKAEVKNWANEIQLGRVRVSFN